MDKGVAFSDRQVEQLTELLHAQDLRTDEKITNLKTELRTEFKKDLDQRFIEERAHVDGKFANLHLELHSIKAQLSTLNERFEGDTKSALEELESLKRRVAVLEQKLA